MDDFFLIHHDNFNSHAHVERDRQFRRLFPALCISTHTLTWSVTNGIIANIEGLSDFNSHAHVERDT